MTKNFTLSKATLNLLTLLGVIGVVISVIQVFHFADVRTGQAAFESFCTVGKVFDCNAIDASPYAELFGGIPLSAAAAGWWLAILVLSVVARSPEFAAQLAPALLAMTGIGAVFSLIYLWIMVAIIKVGCLLCLAMDVVNFVAFGALLRSWVKRAPKTSALIQIKVPAITTAICLGILMLVARSLVEGAPSQEDLQLRTQSIMSAQPVAMNINPELPTVGNPTAKITIIKFSDFQCPSCRIGAQSLHPVLKRYADRIRFVYRNFPLDQKCNRMIKSPMHPAACEMAKGVVCAQAQGKFEPYYERTFDQQAFLEPGSAQKVAQKVGLDLTRFEACMADPATLDRVLKDIEEGINLKVESTPTFFINGRRVTGALPPQSWNALIEQSLQQAK